MAGFLLGVSVNFSQLTIRADIVIGGYIVWLVASGGSVTATRGREMSASGRGETARSGCH